MTGAELLARLQQEAEPSGFHRRLRAWVDGNSETARILSELDTINTQE